MSNAHLRFSPEILKRLGEELNIEPAQGILELVKNAYDADAKTCTVELINVNQPGGTIRITDDGDGMTETGIREGWLVLGTSLKSTKQVTRLGRTPAGSKGLGRLASLRTGSQVRLTTRPREEPRAEHLVEIDWENFDNVQAVDEVQLPLLSQARQPDQKQGSEIVVSNLSNSISRMDVKRLARGMLMLADPFGDDPEGFFPVLEAPEFNDLEQLVKRRYFEDAEFHLQAFIDNEGWASAQVLDFHGKPYFKANHTDLNQQVQTKPYNLRTVKFDLWVFVLNRETFLTRATTIGEVKEWLQEFGGVYLYMNGIRVNPYGNPGDDWLELNLMRARSPELRPSTNTTVGRISLSETQNKLVQKTDRTGIIENESFRELKLFAQSTLNWMARSRVREREERRSQKKKDSADKVQKQKKNLEKSIKDLPKNQKNEFKKAIDTYDRARDEEADALRREVQLYRTLGTAGIISAIFGHEIRHPIELIIRNANQLKRRGKTLLGDLYSENLENSIERIIDQSNLMEGFGELTVGIIEKDKRRNRRVDIHWVINRLMSDFAIIFEERDVQVVTQLASENPYLLGSKAAIESLLTNLIVNSLKAFEAQSPGIRKIIIRSVLEGKELELRILDNGPGIKDIPLAHIWSPGETSYLGGTGLGLTIVRDTVRDLGGDVSAIASGELGGAEFIVKLPILGG
ncbi:MAG: sensor histidine kinase [Thermosynechococcaceae cyanobacterium]